MSKNDQYYIQKVMSGNIDAYRFLVDKYKNIVFDIVLRISKNREDAEELAQDTFLKAFEKLSSFKGKSKFSTWLYRIAYNLAISKTRKKVLPTENIDEYRMEDIEYDEFYKQYELTEQAERQQLLKQALERLPQTDSLLITLFYMDNQSIDDICEITGLSKSNVKVRLHRARKKMFYFLSNMHVFVVFLYGFLLIF